MTQTTHEPTYADLLAENEDLRVLCLRYRDRMAATHDELLSIADDARSERVSNELRSIAQDLTNELRDD